MPAARAVLAVLALTLCACAATPSQRHALPALELPPAWSAIDAAGGGAADASSLVRWWQRFDDPTLGALVTQALQANTGVAAAQAAVRQAQALRDVAAASLWPTLGASASVSHSTSGSRNGNSFQAGVNGDWAPDVFGAKHQALEASTAAAQGSAASLGDVQVQLAAEVGSSYITLRSTQLRWAIASDNLASQQETLQITLWRQQAGLVTALEADQASAAAEQTRALLPALQTGIEQTRHALAVLTGQAPNADSALNRLLASPGPVPQASDDLALGIPAQTLRQRADVRAAEYQVAAALARVAQADAARWPSFSIGGSLGVSAATLGSLTAGASVVSSLLAGVTLPLFDGGAARAQVRAQQAAFDQAEVAYRATVLAALKDVEDALAALRGDRQRLLSLRNAAAAATSAAQLARQRYSSGLVDFQTVLETQRTQLGSQDAVAQASAELSADQVRLFKALGGGWRIGDDSEGLARSEDTLPAIATRTTPP